MFPFVPYATFWGKKPYKAWFNGNGRLLFKWKLLRLKVQFFSSTGRNDLHPKVLEEIVEELYAINVNMLAWLRTVMVPEQECGEKITLCQYPKRVNSMTWAT